MNCLKKPKAKTRDTEAEPIKAKRVSKTGAPLRSSKRAAKSESFLANKPKVGKPTVHSTMLRWPALA